MQYGTRRRCPSEVYFDFNNEQLAETAASELERLGYRVKGNAGGLFSRGTWELAAAPAALHWEED